MPIPDRLLGADEAAKYLAVKRFRIYELARTGIVPSVRLGRQLRFAPAALDAFIAQGGRPLGGGWRRAERGLAEAVRTRPASRRAGRK